MGSILGSPYCGKLPCVWVLWGLGRVKKFSINSPSTRLEGDRPDLADGLTIQSAAASFARNSPVKRRTSSGLMLCLAPAALEGNYRSVAFRH